MLWSSNSMTSSPPAHIFLYFGYFVTEGSFPQSRQKGISSFLHCDKDKSGGELMALYRPIVKNLDSVLTIAGEDASFFPTLQSA